MLSLRPPVPFIPPVTPVTPVTPVGAPPRSVLLGLQGARARPRPRPQLEGLRQALVRRQLDGVAVVLGVVQVVGAARQHEATRGRQRQEGRGGVGGGPSVPGAPGSAEEEARGELCMSSMPVE